MKKYECPTCCERAALTSLRSGSAGPANRTLNTEPVSGSCVQATIRNVQRKVTFLNASGGQVGSADSEINVKGTFCGEGIVFVFVLFMVPLLLLGGFAHMTWGWRRDLKNFVSTALKREMSEAAKAVAQQAATEDDRFGLRGVGSTEGSAKGMIGDSNAYKSSWMKRGHKLGDIDGDGTVDTIGQKQGCCARCCFKLKKFQYMMAGSPEEVMLYTEAMEISLALFSVYRFSALNIGDTFGVQFVILVAFLQCIIAPSLLLSNRPSLCIVAMSVFDMFVDFFYSLMALSRSLTVFNARDACIQEQWSTHPCNGLFVDWTFVDVLLTFYGCVIPPYLFSRKVVRQHTTIAWQNFKYYFDRTSGSVGLQDKQLNRLLHWTSRNIVLLPGPRRDSFLFRVKTFYSIGLMMSFAMWWYLELLPVQDYCEDSGAFFRAVPANFPTGSFLDIDEIATCKGYMEFGVSAYGNDYNATLCSANFTLIEHNYLTYRKICPRQCGQCGSDLTGLRQETAEAQESALFMTFLLSFIFLMIGLLAKATGLGQRCAYRLEAYEGKRDDLAAFNEAQGMSEAALKAELAKVELENSELAEQRLTDLHEQKLDKMLGQEHRNPMMDTDSSDDDDESPKTSHDTKGHYVDDDDDF